LGTGQQPSRRQNLTGQKKPTLRQQAQLTPVALRETAGIRIVPNERKRQSQSIGCATARVILHQFSSINLSEQIHLTTGEGTLVLFPDFSFATGYFWTSNCADLIFLGETTA
jgi:hypothetical protein